MDFPGKVFRNGISHGHILESQVCQVLEIAVIDLSERASVGTGISAHLREISVRILF